MVRFAEEHAKILVLEGLPEVFCWGADFGEIAAGDGDRHGDGGGVGGDGRSPAADLYDLWLSLAFGSFVSVAHVRGKVNAGGVGFVAACDIVLCADTVTFSLSELLFGLMPACVLPFLIRKVGLTKANFITLMTQPFTAEQAVAWHLVDAGADNSDNLLRRHLLRLRYLPKTGVTRYKNYLRDARRHPDPLPGQGRRGQPGGVLGQGEPAQDRALCDHRAVPLGGRVDMQNRPVEYREITPSVVQITMQDTVHKNTFSDQLITGLQDAFAQVGANDRCKAVVLTGYGNYFASGGTKESLLLIQERRISFTDADIYGLALDCPVPVIAAMQGHGIGGGFAMGMFADFVILSQESIYTTNFMKYGFTPGMGATLVLPRKLGSSLAGGDAALGEDLLRSRTEAAGRPLPGPATSRGSAPRPRTGREPRRETQDLPGHTQEPSRVRTPRRTPALHRARGGHACEDLSPARGPGTSSRPTTQEADHMPESRVFDLIVEHVREVVPELEDHRFQPSDSLRDLGANSIDRAEIIIMTLEVAVGKHPPGRAGGCQEHRRAGGSHP